jgi:hypothetical protein
MSELDVDTKTLAAQLKDQCNNQLMSSYKTLSGFKYKHPNQRIMFDALEVELKRRGLIRK